MLEAHHSNIKHLGLFLCGYKGKTLKDTQLPKLHEILPVYSKMKWGTKTLKIVFGEKLILPDINSHRYMTSWGNIFPFLTKIRRISYNCGLNMQVMQQHLCNHPSVVLCGLLITQVGATLSTLCINSAGNQEQTSPMICLL